MSHQPPRMGLLHHLSHVFGWARGDIGSRWDGERLFMTWKCQGCSITQEFEVEPEPVQPYRPTITVGGVTTPVKSWSIHVRP